MFSSDGFGGDGFSGLPDDIIDAILGADVFSSGRLSRVLAAVRRRLFPMVLASMNTQKITVVRGFAAQGTNDDLETVYSESTQEVDAVVFGATVETIESGVLTAGDYEVIVAAEGFGLMLTKNDAIRIDGQDYEVVQARELPKYPEPVAYRMMCKRVA